jgi:hypothetical protein
MKSGTRLRVASLYLYSIPPPYTLYLSITGQAYVSITLDQRTENKRYSNNMANINSVDIMALKKGEVNLGVSRCPSTSVNLDLLALDIHQLVGTRLREINTAVMDWTQ